MNPPQILTPHILPHPTPRNRLPPVQIIPTRLNPPRAAIHARLEFICNVEGSRI
jgi:hypothetical protein